MKKMGWLGIAVVGLALGFSLGWSQSQRVDTIGEKKIKDIKKNRLMTKKSELVPERIEILEFHSEVLNQLLNDEDTKYIQDHYAKGESYYLLKKNITTEEKSKIYDIFLSAGMEFATPLDGCQESGGY